MRPLAWSADNVIARLKFGISKAFADFMGVTPIRDGGGVWQDTARDHARASPGDSPVGLEFTLELRSELLDPESWGKILELYARTMKVAVALLDAEDHLVGVCHNPQPIWSLARGEQPVPEACCVFCLETLPHCTAVDDALRNGYLSVVHDAAGFAHVALPLTMGDVHIGSLLAGQVLDRYPEPLPLQRVARDFGLSAQEVWHLARQQAPVSRANLTIYGELLRALGQTFLRDRYGVILERRLTETTKAFNLELATVNTKLNRKVVELEAAEHRAENARVYAESIVATIREPLVVLDESFHVVSANDAFYEKFQTGAEDAEGRLLYELEDRQWDNGELRRLLGEVLPRDQWFQDFEMQHNFAHIGPRTMVLNARRVDHVDLILLAIEDITERKLSENLLRKVNLDLKHFSYAASHDLQEPLRMVTSYTQLLAREYKGKLDSRADQFIAYTLDGAQRLGTLLKDLREYWLVSERINLCIPIDSGEVLERTIGELQVPIAESSASITWDLLPTVVAEEVSLAMLFQNLLGNAIKYHRIEEAPSVHVSAQKQANTWLFSVTDNGIGIPAKSLEEVFAPFRRLHGKEYPGSGIGLALCSKIVERYGGRLWVESQPGKGSTFFFTIPATTETVL
ncbi:MAG: PocR ligand-binding domain-containing protein [Bryobacteraceae bacterium]|nr:PocR ligand-binding domain-containing protein [Bryobacteraceae bacterium]